MKRIFAITAAFVLLLTTACATTADVYEAGTYTATAEGYKGDVTVEVEFDKESIVSVKVTDHNETEDIGGLAADQLPEQIVEAQTWDVDVVTSATVTSEAIKIAVKDCMEQASVE